MLLRRENLQKLLPSSSIALQSFFIFFGKYTWFREHTHSLVQLEVAMSLRSYLLAELNYDCSKISALRKYCAWKVVSNAPSHWYIYQAPCMRKLKTAFIYYLLTTAMHIPVPNKINIHSVVTSSLSCYLPRCPESYYLIHTMSNVEGKNIILLKKVSQDKHKSSPLQKK